ncbi:hypothetical protein V8C42DRAFT_319275 [Trichoderma barbatum]
MNLVAKSPFHRHLVHISRSTGISVFKVKPVPGRTPYYHINPQFQPQRHHTTSKPTNIHNQSQSPSQPPKMSQPTFQLWEFTLLYGSDMHYLVLIQTTNNSTTLTTLKQNLRHAISSRSVVIHPRIYTKQDIVNIQTSAIDVLRRFESTNDCVDVVVASGLLDVKLNDANPTSSREEAEWFESVFESVKFPKWENLGGRAVSMFDGEYQPEQ